MIKYLSRLKAKKGLTLVEVMIATVIFTLIMLAAFTMYQPINTVASIIRSDSDMQRVIAASEGFISRQVRNAAEIEIIWGTELPNAATRAQSFIDPTCADIGCTSLTPCVVDAHRKNKDGDIPQALILRPDGVFNLRLNDFPNQAAIAAAFANPEPHRIFNNAFYTDVNLDFQIAVTPDDPDDQRRGHTYLMMQVDAWRSETGGFVLNLDSRSVSDTQLTWIGIFARNTSIGEAGSADNELALQARFIPGLPHICTCIGCMNVPCTCPCTCDATTPPMMTGAGPVAGSDVVILYHNNMHNNRNNLPCVSSNCFIINCTSCCDSHQSPFGVLPCDCGTPTHPCGQPLNLTCGCSPYCGLPCFGSVCAGSGNIFGCNPPLTGCDGASGGTPCPDCGVSSCSGCTPGGPCSGTNCFNPTQCPMCPHGILTCNDCSDCGGSIGCSGHSYSSWAPSSDNPSILERACTNPGCNAVQSCGPTHSGSPCNPCGYSPSVSGSPTVTNMNGTGLNNITVSVGGPSQGRPASISFTGLPTTGVNSTRTFDIVFPYTIFSPQSWTANGAGVALVGNNTIRVTIPAWGTLQNTFVIGYETAGVSFM